MTKDAGLTRRWVRATWGGWLLGIPCVIALALAGEAVGIGGSQVLVGAGMGAGVGFMQGRVMRGVMGKAAPWAAASLIGLALPFLATDLANIAGLHPAYSLHLGVATGGLVVGAWQALLLRPRFPRAPVWVPVSLVAWTLAAGTTALADVSRYARWPGGIAGALVYLGLIGVGGLVLGLVTGAVLGWMLRQEATA